MTANDPSPNHLQLTRDGQLRHFLTLDGLGRELLTELVEEWNHISNTIETLTKESA